MTLRKSIELGFGIFLAVWFVVGAVTFSQALSKHDADIEAEAEAYTLCIFSQYHMTPAEYNGEYGTFPACTN